MAWIQSRINHSRAAGRAPQGRTPRAEINDQTRLLHHKAARIIRRGVFSLLEKHPRPHRRPHPRLRKLIQSHRINIPGDKYSPAYDGIAELWFDTVEDLLAARQSPEWQASTEDEANFIDHTKVAYFVTEEHIIM